MSVRMQTLQSMSNSVMAPAGVTRPTFARVFVDFAGLLPSP